MWKTQRLSEDVMIIISIFFDRTLRNANGSGAGAATVMDLRWAEICTPGNLYTETKYVRLSARTKHQVEDLVDGRKDIPSFLYDVVYNLRRNNQFDIYPGCFIVCSLKNTYYILPCLEIPTKWFVTHPPHPWCLRLNIFSECKFFRMYNFPSVHSSKCTIFRVV